MAKQKQITEQILKETEKIKAISDAEREKVVQEIHIQQKIEVWPVNFLFSWKHAKRFAAWIVLKAFSNCYGVNF